MKPVCRRPFHCHHILCSKITVTSSVICRALTPHQIDLLFFLSFFSLFDALTPPGGFRRGQSIKKIFKNTKKFLFFQHAIRIPGKSH